MSGKGEGRMVMQTSKKLVFESKPECDEEARQARPMRIKGRMQKKQLKFHKKHPKWEQKHVRPNRRGSRALELQVAKERTGQQGVVETKTCGKPGALVTRPTRRSERVKHAVKRAGRASYALACHELCFTQDECADYVPREAARTESKEYVVMVWRIKAECNFTREPHARIEARENKKQWEAERVPQSCRNNRTLEHQVAEEQAVVETKTHSELGALATKPTRRSKRVKNAAKLAGRARHEIACHELYFTQDEGADSVPHEAARTESKVCIVTLCRIKTERDFTCERRARMEAQEHKKQLKLRREQLEWEAKRARQNGRYEQEVTCEVAQEQAAKRLVVNATTDGDARTTKPCKKMRRAQREIRLQECHNRSSAQSTCDVGFLDFGLNEQPSDATLVNEEEQEQQHKLAASCSECEPVLRSQSNATAGLVAWLMVPLNWMVARLQ